MKKLYIISMALSAVCFAGSCTPEEDAASENPIAFSINIGGFETVLEESVSSPSAYDGLQAGVFVNATREMLYHVEQDRLVADEADIPEYYGMDAYAVVPATREAAIYADSYISVPSEQTYADGINPNLINSFAYAPVTDGSAVFSFEPMTAVIELGFTSDNSAKISSMIIEANYLEAQNYLSGRKGFDFDGTSFTVNATAKDGSNSIRVSFPDNITLSSEPTYIPVAVLPFMTSGGGIDVTLYNESGYPCEIEGVLTDNDDYCNGGALDVSAGEYIRKTVGNIGIDDFTLPSLVKFGVKENKTGNYLPDRTVNIYSVMGNTETFVQSVTTGDDGYVTFELIPGNYKAYVQKEDGSDDLIRNVLFASVAEVTTEVTLVYYSFDTTVFHDDFNWITPDMGEDGVTLDYFVTSIDPPAVNNGTKANSRIDVASASAQAKANEIGWDFYMPGRADPDKRVTFVFLRLGEIQLGKSSGYAQATTPALTSLAGVSDVLLSIIADPFYSVKNGVASALPTQLKVTIIGNGSFSSETDVKEAATAPIEAGDLSRPQAVPEGEPKTFGQKSYYDFMIYSADSQTKICIASYDEKVADPWNYSQRQILIDDVKVSLAE